MIPLIKVFIADDHALLAESLQFKLQQDEKITVAGIATNGHDAIARCIELQPDVVLLDIKMPGCSGIEAGVKIKNACPETKIVMLTTFDERENIIAAVSHHCDGYILKDVRPEELIMAVKCIFSGFMVMHAALKSFFQELATNTPNQRQTGWEQKLKQDEAEIIRLISDGKNNKEIADLLNYSEGTIKNRISKIMEKFEVADRTQLVVFALKNDLI